MFHDIAVLQYLQNQDQTDFFQKTFTKRNYSKLLATSI